MKKIAILAVALCMALGVCMYGVSSSIPEEIVGQWVRENRGEILLIEPDGKVFQIDTNVAGEYITAVITKSDDGYDAPYCWYKEDGKYYFDFRVYNCEARVDGETLVLEHDEWRRLSDNERLSNQDIHFFVLDKDSMAYIDHTLDEILE